MPRLVQVRTTGKLRANIQSCRTRYGDGVERGIRAAAIYLLRESRRIVPIDTGALRASGRISTTGDGLATKAIVSYNTNYAVYVHEDLNARHAPGKTAKYLERPAREKAAEIRQIVRDEVRREAARGR